MPAMTRGPLPSSVYWRRRLVVLTVVLLFLWLVLHLLGGGGGRAPKASPAASLTRASASASASGSPSEASSPTASAAVGGASASASGMPSVAPTPSPTVLPTPTGDCSPSDLSVTPSVAAATAGSNVAITLTLHTFATPACTWHVSHKTMQVKVSTASGRDVWSTVQCPAALPATDVVVYQDAAPAPVTLTWSSRLSDAECSAHTAWARAGAYDVTAVALGGVPTQSAFTLAAPVAAAPPATPSASASISPSATPSAPAPSASSAPTKKHHKKH